MKVVHLMSGGDIGGAKTHIETLLPKLNQLGCESWFLCVMEGDLSAECRKRGVKVMVIPQKGRSDLSVIKKMAVWIKEEKFDLVHCHGARANFIAFFLRFYLRIPMVTTIHSDYKLDFIGGGYRQFVYTPLNVLSLKRFKHFITISEEFKQMLIQRGFKPDRIDVVYNGVSFPETIPVRGKLDFLSEYGINPGENTVLIGCVARLHPVKGVSILLKAAKELFEDNSVDTDVLFLIAGSGGEKQNLVSYAEKNGLKDKVYFLGFIEDVSSFYAAIDINVVPSLSEGFSLAIVEGARFKLNTVASDVGGIPEVLGKGENGLLFPPGDYKALSEILKNEIKNPEEGRKRGKRLFEDTKRRFSDVRMAERHMEVYKKILENYNQLTREEIKDD